MTNIRAERQSTIDASSALDGVQFLPAPAHYMPIDRLLAEVGMDRVTDGLSDFQVKQRRQTFGANEMGEASPIA